MNEDSIKLSIVIPAYNEADNAPLLIKNLSNICKKNKTIEIIIVENGSVDNTRNVLMSLKHQAELDGLKILFLDKNMGYGGGIVEGLKVANGRFLGWTHADLQTDPEDLILCLDFLHNEPKIFIKGFRKGRGALDRFFSFLMGIVESLIFNSSLKEVNAQPTIFPKSLITNFNELPKDFMIDLYIFVKAKFHNLKIKRFEVQFLDRKHGNSSWNRGLFDVLKFSVTTIKKSLKIKTDEDYKA